MKLCVSATSETLLHPPDRWLQRLALPDKRLPHAQILQLGHGLLGQDRQRTQDMSKDRNSGHHTVRAAPFITNTHKTKT